MVVDHQVLIQAIVIGGECRRGLMTLNKSWFESENSLERIRWRGKEEGSCCELINGQRMNG